MVGNYEQVGWSVCGIAGFWSARALADPDSVLTAMTSAIRHRGPDASGIWSDSESGVFFGHRRLAIIDLSVQGAQPMTSSSGRYVIVYNGEIYNHELVRAKLEGNYSACRWRGHSDTETLLASIECYGLQRTMQIINGMFAFALWDRAEKTMTLVRDKLGEKPLYYANSGGQIVFGSELRVLRAFTGLSLEISPDGIAGLFANAYISSPASIYKNVYKLRPGCMIIFSSPKQENVIQRQYWEMASSDKPQSLIDIGSDRNQWREELSGRVSSAVHSRMMADVPLGAFLSGGIDSSLVTAIMQENSMQPVKTFTIGMSESSHDESKHARAVANHLGTEHTEFYLTDKDILDVVPVLPSIWDEPFADSSQIPTYLVSKLSSQHVTVALSGDGGDELFGGYRRYAKAQKLWRKLSCFPHWMRSCVTGLSTSAIERFPETLATSKLRKIQLMASLISSRSDEELYHALQRHWKTPEEVVYGTKGIAPPKMLDVERCGDFRLRMMHVDSGHYLPDDILTKVDRASMAVSLESRAPLLDVELVEFAWHSPTEFKLEQLGAKMPLKRELEKYVPYQIIDRPKMGFGIPIGEWLRGPLREWAQDLIEPGLMKRQGYIDPAPIQAIWQQHINREWTWEYLLWDVLMFQSWLSAHHE